MFAKFLTSVVACIGLMSTPNAVSAGGNPADYPAELVRGRKLAQKLSKADDLTTAKKFDLAEETYKEVLKLDSENVPALTGLAWLYNHQGNFNEAIDRATDALAIDRTNSSAWREYGYGLWKKGKKVQAVKALSKAIDNKKRNWAAYDYLISVLEELKETDAADLIRRMKKQEKEAIERVCRVD